MHLLTLHVHAYIYGNILVAKQRLKTTKLSAVVDESRQKLGVLPMLGFTSQQTDNIHIMHCCQVLHQATFQLYKSIQLSVQQCWISFICTSTANASIFQQKTASQLTIQASNVSNKQFTCAAYSKCCFSKYNGHQLPRTWGLTAAFQALTTSSKTGSKSHVRNKEHDLITAQEQVAKQHYTA